MLKRFLLLFLIAGFHYSGFGQNSWVQLIHNCADPAADTLDVYLNGNRIDSNFAYRSATPFTGFPISSAVNIGIAHKHSSSVNDTIKSFHFDSLNLNQNYIFIISGVTGSNFAANPDGRSIGLDLKVIYNAKTSDTTGGFSFSFFNGITDETGLNMIITPNWLFVHAAAYGDITSYGEIWHNWYDCDMFTRDSSENLGRWVIDFTNVGGQAGVILASGFAEPDSNNGGPAMTMFAALANGVTIVFPPETAVFQLLHNSADPALDTVDVYLNGKKRFPNLPFRSATAAVTVKANIGFTYALAPKNSVSAGSAFWSLTDTLGTDTFYVNTAVGVTGAGFTPNPEGKSIAFEVLRKAPCKIVSSGGRDFDFFFIHGVTDASELNIQLSGGPDILINQAYTYQSKYFSLPPSVYTMQVQDTAGNNSYPYYVTDFTGLGTQSGVILASGFLHPAANNNGPAFGLFMAGPQGGPFVQLSTNVGIRGLDNSSGLNVYPNPASDYVLVPLPLNARPAIEIMDMNGRIIQTFQAENQEQLLRIDLKDLSNGSYIARVITGSEVNNRKFVVLR